MARTNVVIPLNRGIDQTLDERLRGPDQLSVVTNGYYRRNDAITKRFGFTALTNVVDGTRPDDLASEGTPRGLFSTGDELCVRGYRSLYAYAPGNGFVAPKWYWRGELSAMTGAQRNIFSDTQNISSCDVAEVEGYVLHAAIANNPISNSTNVRNALLWRVETTDGLLVKEQTQVESTTSTYQYPQYFGVRCVNHNNAAGNTGSIWVGYQRRAVASPPTGVPWRLIFEEWNSATPDQFGVSSFQENDLWWLPTPNEDRWYDACPISVNGRFAYAYLRIGGSYEGGIPLDNSIRVRLRDPGVLATLDIPPSAINRRFLKVGINYGTFSNSIYVIAYEATIASPFNGSIRVWSLNPGTLAIQWQTDLDAAIGVNQLCENLGIAEGLENELGQWIVTGVWTESSSSGFVYDIHRRSLTTGGALTDAEVLQPMAKAISKPFWYGGRCMVAASPTSSFQQLGVNSGIEAFNQEMLVDIRPGQSLYNNDQFQLVGRYNLGVTTIGTIRGSLQSVQAFEASTWKFRYETQRVSFSATSTYLTPGSYLTSGDVIELDFRGVTTNSIATRGSAIIGGANACWYTGNRTEELGFCTAPSLSVTVAPPAVVGTLTSGSNYQYCAHYESYDEKGTLIRSMPGPVVNFTMPGGGHTATIVKARSNSASLRNGQSTGDKSVKRYGVAIYRADSDGLFQRCSPPESDTLDQNYQSYFRDFYDTGAEMTTLYTQGGAEVEASGPDGAAFAVTTSKRVWLAGFFKRDRVSYSKLYNPSSANEYVLAPEFNEAFAFMLPGGEQCTGLCELDDKVIVFTRSNIYAIAGNGPDDGGRGNDFSGLQLIASDTGCIDARSIVASPRGVFFQAPSGMFLLGRDLSLDFIGAAVRDVTDVYTECTSAVLVPAANHVRFTLRQGGESGTILIYDFDQRAWLQWTPQKVVSENVLALNIVGAALHQGVYYVLDASGTVYYEDATTHYDAGSLYVPLVIETGWLQAAQQSGWQRIRNVSALCKWNDAHSLTMNLYQDFQSAPSQTFTWTQDSSTKSKLMELVMMRVSQQKCTAFKLRIEDGPDPFRIDGQGYECAGFAVELGGKRGMYKPGTQQRN